MSQRRPRVAVDANPATRDAVTGTERFAMETARRLPGAAPEIDFELYASRPAQADGLDVTVLPGRRLWSQLRLPVQSWRHPPDLLYVPSHVVPFLWRGAAVTVVHDLAFERFPDAYRPADRAYLRLTTAWAVRRCRRLIVVSQATADDLCAAYPVEPERITVVHLGGGEAVKPASHQAARRRLERLGVERPFVLQVGRVEPRKNQLTALAAVERLPDLTLVSAGPIVDAAMAAKLESSPRCRLLGRVPAADLEALYGEAEALVFPSLYEGFGLPLLAAMRRGLPIATSWVSSIPEIAGDAAVYVQDPTDPVALAEAVRGAIQDRDRLARRGRRLAGGFTWDRTAAGVAAVIRLALEDR